MPNYLVYQCAECKTFQSGQEKKNTNKFECKICHIKQSIRKVYMQSDSPSELRPLVQELNTRRGEQEQYVYQGAVEEEEGEDNAACRREAFGYDESSYEKKSFASSCSSSSSALFSNKQSISNNPPSSSRWGAFLDASDVSQREEVAVAAEEEDSVYQFQASTCSAVVNNRKRQRGSQHASSFLQQQAKNQGFVVELENVSSGLPQQNLSCPNPNIRSLHSSVHKTTGQNFPSRNLQAASLNRSVPSSRLNELLPSSFTPSLVSPPVHSSQQPSHTQHAPQVYADAYPEGERGSSLARQTASSSHGYDISLSKLRPLSCASSLTTTTSLTPTPFSCAPSRCSSGCSLSSSRAFPVKQTLPLRSSAPSTAVSSKWGMYLEAEDVQVPEDTEDYSPDFQFVER